MGSNCFYQIFIFLKEFKLDKNFLNDYLFIWAKLKYFYLFLMSFDEKLSEIKLVYTSIINLMDNDENEEINIRFLFHIFQKQKISENHNKIKSILLLLINIANYHYRSNNFFQKIEKILIYFNNQIRNDFTSAEIYNIFKSNNRMLLFFVENKIIKIQQLQGVSFQKYFLQELNPNCENIPKNYEENRRRGENEDIICEMIRTDSVENFISHVNKTNFKIESRIKESIYETNSYLINRNFTLIEYAAFSGSIEIFQYLRFNGVELTPSL